METTRAWSRLGVAVAVLAVLYSVRAPAAEWSFEPSVSLRAEYNDNFEITPEDKIPVWGGILTPRVRFTGATEALSVAGVADISLKRYVDHPEYDVNGYNLSILSNYKTERDLVGLDVTAFRDASTLSEFTTTGVILTSQTTDQWTVTPYWTRSLTERTSATARYAYSRSYYDDEGSTALSNYVNQRLSVGLQSRIDETKTYFAEAFYARYDTRPAQTRQNSYGISGGYNHAFSETLTGTLAAGWSWTDSTLSAGAQICDGPIVAGQCTGSIVEITSVEEFRDSGGILNASLAWRSETDTMSGALSQNINPSGSGSVAQTRRAGANWGRQWSETVSSSMDVSAYATNYLGEVLSNSDSTSAQFNARLSWRFHEEWTLDAGYSFTRQKFESEPTAANQNLVYLTLGYAGRKLSISR